MIENDIIPITDRVQIPVHELEYRFSPSRGPGGQHVNRAHTRVTLLFDIANSPSLDEQDRAVLLDALSARMDKHGVLQVTAQDTRSQAQNRELAISRFVALLSEALAERTERIVTKPPKKAKERRMEEKKKHSQRKEERSHDWSQEV